MLEISENTTDRLVGAVSGTFQTIVDGKAVQRTFIMTFRSGNQTLPSPCGDG